MNTFTEIAGCNGTVIYQVVEKEMTFFTSGRLQIHIAYDGMVLLKLCQFEYAIKGSQTIIYDNADPQFALVLHIKKNPSDLWILKINQNADAVFSCLEEKCYLKDKNQKYKKQETKQEQPQKNEKKSKAEKPPKAEKKKEVVIDNNEEVPEQQKKEKGLIIEASKQLGKGITYTGQLFSKGFSSLGGFIAKKVPKVQDKEISTTTKQNLKLTKNTTKNVFQFASDQVGNLFTFGKKVASDVGERFEHTQKGKELQENPYYDTAIQGTKTTGGVIANLYIGVVGAVYAVGSGMAQGVSKVVGARYGQDAEEALDEGLQGAGNVFRITRVPVDQLANTMK